MKTSSIVGDIKMGPRRGQRRSTTTRCHSPLQQGKNGHAGYNTNHIKCNNIRTSMTSKRLRPAMKTTIIVIRMSPVIKTAMPVTVITKSQWRALRHLRDKIKTQATSYTPRASLATVSRYIWKREKKEARFTVRRQRKMAERQVKWNMECQDGLV